MLIADQNTEFNYVKTEQLPIIFTASMRINPNTKLPYINELCDYFVALAKEVQSTRRSAKYAQSNRLQHRISKRRFNYTAKLAIERTSQFDKQNLIKLKSALEQSVRIIKTQ